MTLINVLTSDGDIERVQSGLHDTLVSLGAITSQLAITALGQSTCVLTSAMNSEPVLSAHNNTLQACRNIELVRSAAKAAEFISELLSAAKESDDDVVNACYRMYLASAVNTAAVSGMLVEAERRITLAAQSIPQNATHTTRFNGTLFTSSAGV